MARKIDILQYLPFFMQQFLELQLITEVENKVLQEAIEELEVMNNNQFILTADSNGLKRYEQMLGITNLPGETLEARRIKVLSKWNDKEVYTWASFIEELNLICGEGNYRLVEHFTEYWVELHTELSDYGAMEELERVIDYMIPCNLLFDIQNDLTWVIQGKSEVGGALHHVEIYDCNDQSISEFENASEHSFSGGVHFIENYTNSDQYEISFDNKSSHDFVGKVHEVMIIETSDSSNKTFSADGTHGFIGAIHEVTVVSSSDK